VGAGGREVNDRFEEPDSSFLGPVLALLFDIGWYGSIGYVVVHLLVKYW
jgi:hypothetical protein